MVKRISIRSGAAGLLVTASAFGQFAATGAGTVSVAVAAEAAIHVATATTTLSNGAGTTLNTNYFKPRSTKATGTASITVRNTEFAGNGHRVARAELKFTCTAASGTPCSGTKNARTAAGVAVVSFAASASGAHSANAGDGATVAWQIVDKPRYETGTYTSTATFTIPATWKYTK